MPAFVCEIAQGTQGWFTIAPIMLQDLDQLAARIGQLVQRTRQLHAENDALRFRLAEADSGLRSAKQLCAEREAELSALREKSQDLDGAVTAVQEQSRQIEMGLREQLQTQEALWHEKESLLTAREAQLQDTLSSREAELQHLRQAAAHARERIEAVLARLPGAPVGESQ